MNVSRGIIVDQKLVQACEIKSFSTRINGQNERDLVRKDIVN